MRAAGLLLLACGLLAAPLHAQPASKPTRVYGFEIDVNPKRDRLLVFADGPVRPDLKEVDASTVMLIVPDVTLDPSAPRGVRPEPGGVVTGVSAFETAGRKEVRFTIKRSAHVAPPLTLRGGQIALEFRRGARARTPAREKDERTLDARWLKMNVREVVTRLARFANTSLIFDERLTGRVSIDAPTPITEAEARAMIDTLLLMKGFTAVPSPGGPLKVVPLAGAPAPWVVELERDPSGAALTTLIRLEQLDAGLVHEAITPLVGEYGIAELFAPTNSILLAGPANRLRRIVDVARTLDEAGVRRLVLVPIQYADAQEVSEALGLFAKRRLRGFEIWPDLRTNRIVMRGRPADVEEARAFLARVDRPDVGFGAIQVLPVRHADVEKVAEILRAMTTTELRSGVEGGASLAGRDFAVSVHRPSHALVVQADPQTMGLVADILAEIDRPPEMAYVEVSVTEVSISGSLALAFDALLPLSSPKDTEDLISFLAANPSGALLGDTESNLFAIAPGRGFRGRIGRTPLRVPVLGGDGLPVLGPDGTPLVLNIPRDTYVVTAEEGEVRSRLLLHPHLSLVSGEEHRIFSGENVPVPVAQTGGTGSALEVRQDIERRDTGVTLRVEPTIPKEGPIALRIALDLSAVSGAIDGGTTFIERELEAIVRLEAGQEAFLASASLPTTNRIEAGTPFLKDIPFIGWLFRSTRDRQMVNHIFVTVRARRDRPEAEALRRQMMEALRSGAPEVATGTSTATP